MIIDCISDLHGFYPKLEGGDLLIVAGDLTMRDTYKEYIDFNAWLLKQKYRKKILVAGNHDNWIMNSPMLKNTFYDCEYLCDSGTEITYYPRFDPPNLDNIGVPYKRKTLKIWGSPWTKTFEGMNPKYKAFTCDTEKELIVKFSLIPDDIDVLVTHSPPWGILDKNIQGQHCGSKSLGFKVGKMRIPPKLWVWGHIHESYGVDLPIRQKPCKMVNASLINERYEPINKPITIEL